MVRLERRVVLAGESPVRVSTERPVADSSRGRAILACLQRRLNFIQKLARASLFDRLECFFVNSRYVVLSLRRSVSRVPENGTLG